MKNRKAMSAVVTSVILIALVLIALGVVWAVISNLIQERSGTIDVQNKCLDMSVKAIATSSVCDATGCTVTLRREGGTGTIEGAKVLMTDGSTYSNAVTYTGDIAPFETASAVFDAAAMNSIVPTKVEVSVGVLDESTGDTVYCSNPTTYIIA